MSQLDFYIVDVFAEEKYAGNQLAVFIDLEQQLTAQQMLQITREINFAESSFITAIHEDGSFRVRIFTTEYEVPFAGHPTLGSVFIIAKHLMQKPSNKLVLQLNKGAIPVEISNPDTLDKSRFTMQQAQPDFWESYNAQKVSDAFDIPLDAFDLSMPIQQVNTGLPYLIIFLKDLKSMAMIKLNSDKVEQFLKEKKLYKDNSELGLSTSLFFVTRETEEKENNFHTRMFVLENGTIWEDAATGSANGCLLAYLLKHENRMISAKVEQGFEMGRKFILYLDGKVIDDQYDLKVGGQVAAISKGTWSI